MRLLLTNATVTDPSSKHHTRSVNILIESGKILQIGDMADGDKVVDLEGKPVYPGFADLFAHFADPGFEHKEDLRTGAMCAVAGGFTDVALIPNTDPVTETKSDIEYIRSRSRYGVDVWPIAAVSEGSKGENLTEILDLHAAGAVAFSDGIHPVWNTELLLKVLQYVRKFDGLVISRPKDQHLSHYAQMHEGVVSTSLGLKGEPSISEELAIQRDLEIVRYTGGRLHFSQLSASKSVALIRKAKDEGLAVTCDVAIHQLLYNDEALTGFDSNYKVDPPFRTEDDRQALLAAVREGTIDAIVSAHLPQDTESKDLEFDLALPGIISFQTFYSQLIRLSEEVPLENLISCVTSGPRRVLELPEVRIEEGCQAKIAVGDPEKEWVFDAAENLSKSTNSPLFGQTLKGRIRGIVNGDFVSI